MDGLTEMEIKIFREYLKEEWGEINDFFRNNNEDWTTDDFRVMEWQLKDSILLDIHGGPGDNEDGAIFLNGKMYVPMRIKI